ncbi:MAG: antitoxin VbhA family protein [Spirochaetales bacterium]|nr:antitoxin VbhA family protein [Spirochaetales bacterium]MDY5913730.1 antitoxin VbhA family protein [Treponema sp.]
MKDNKLNPFKLDFDSYILQSEPEQQENGKLWQTAIGLQQVDGLTPSKYLYETAKRNIDGEITIEEAKQLIDSYYETRQDRKEDEDDFEEADKVSVRIREILAEKTFDYSKLSREETKKHLTSFIANIWQIHPFGDALVP